MPPARLAAEWEQQSAILLAWPHLQTDWATHLDVVEQTYCELVAAISKFQRVLLCVPDMPHQERVCALICNTSTHMDKVQFAHVPYQDTWLRDSGPITMQEQSGHFSVMDFQFTGWGWKCNSDQDNLLVRRLYAQGKFGKANHVEAPFILEGGAIDVDGQGTLLTTWRCMHHRHPHCSVDEITQQLCQYLGIHRVLWLHEGYLEGDDTEAHIDTLARFSSPDSIVFQSCNTPSDSHYQPLQAMAKELADLRTPHGKPYTLHPLPWPQHKHYDGHRRLAASYANFLIINRAVLMPSYRDPMDSVAQQVLADAFPDRQIIPVDCCALIQQNGSLHCATMQLPHGLL